jgi:hypothetical protein
MTRWLLLGLGLAEFVALALLCRPRPASLRCPQCGRMPQRIVSRLGQRTFYACGRCRLTYDRVQR